jgi:hypothetical protein
MKPLDSGFGEDPESRYGEYSYLGPDWKPVVEKYVIFAAWKGAYHLMTLPVLGFVQFRDHTLTTTRT